MSPFDSFQTSGSSPTRVAVLGFGTVGSAVARRLAAQGVAGLQLTHILDRRASLKQRTFTPSGSTDILWTDRFEDIVFGDADVVVDAIGGIEPSLRWIREALLAGKSVVTANKQVMAHEGAGLRQLAARQGRQIRCEAAVGGAMPVVRGIGDGLSGECIERIAAILNGTCNSVLSRIEATGCSLEIALADARQRGFAEADASDDLDGIDARAKLTILCQLAFGLNVDPALIDTASIRGIDADDFMSARQRGQTIRQIAYAAYDRPTRTLSAWIAPSLVPLSSLFARTTGVQNMVVTRGEYAGEMTFSGPGAGGDATAVAVISDLLTIARDRAAIVPAPRLTSPDNVTGLEHLFSDVASGFSRKDLPDLPLVASGFSRKDLPLINFSRVWNEAVASRELNVSEAV
jgi:homoserine dehydrogenase